MIKVLECFVKYSCSVIDLDYILIIVEKWHMSEQNNICFCRKSSNQIAFLHPVSYDSTKQPTLFWHYQQSVCIVVVLSDPNVPDIEDEAWMKIYIWISLTSSIQPYQSTETKLYVCFTIIKLLITHGSAQ